MPVLVNLERDAPPQTGKFVKLSEEEMADGQKGSAVEIEQDGKTAKVPVPGKVVNKKWVSDPKAMGAARKLKAEAEVVYRARKDGDKVWLKEIEPAPKRRRSTSRPHRRMIRTWKSPATPTAPTPATGAVQAGDSREIAFSMDPARPRHALPLVLLLLTAAVFVWSGVGPHDRFTWVLETFPAIAGVPLLVVLYLRGVRLTPLVYVLLALHAMILMVGGKYTYAEVPPFNWLRDALHLLAQPLRPRGPFRAGVRPGDGRARNPAPHVAAAAGQVAVLPGGLRVRVRCACYELVEWAVAVMSGSASDAFLGTQGDPWDTQKDMALAFVGAITAQVLLSRVQDRQLQRTQVPVVLSEQSRGGV